MASIIKTTAISLRKGDSEANRSFTGILGELVADLGADGSGTDINTTLRLHNGVVQGGIPMCRADFLNMSTRQLAEGRQLLGMTDEKNLAYANLSNLERLTDGTAIELVHDILCGYNLADVELRNVKISDFDDFKGDNDANLPEGKIGLAYKNTSNVDTGDLVNPSIHTDTGTGTNKPLAYADTRNINTADLTNTDIHNNTPSGNKPLAYADASNIDTTNLEDRLARIDLDNVSGESFNTVLFSKYNTLLKIEQTSNKTNADLHTITSSVKYPTVPAVKNYVAYEIEHAGYLKTDYSNSESYEILYSNSGNTNAKNNTNGWLYLPDKSNYTYPTGVKVAGTNFVAGKIYPPSTSVTIDTGTNKSDHLKVWISAVDGNGLPTAAEFYQTQGADNLGSTGTLQIKNEDTDVVNIGYSCTAISGTSLYKYTVTSITPASGVTTGEYSANAIYDPVVPIPLTQLLWLHVDTANNGGVLSYSIVPTTGDTALDNGVYTFTPYPNTGTNAQVYLKAIHINSLGGAGLAKTDLTNLLGMTPEDAESERGRQWRIKQDEDIPAFTEVLPDESNKYETIATQGQVYNAIQDAIYKQAVPKWQPNTAYTAGSSLVFYSGNIYVCKTTHTSGDSWSATNWNYLGNSTYEFVSRKANAVTGGTRNFDATSTSQYPSSKVVADYITVRLDQYALADTYRGQVDLYVATENDLPTTGLSNGYKVMVNNYNSTNVPHIYTYNGSAWTHEAFINTTSQQANGDYVYCLDLGNWATTKYYHAPGNLTWNHSTQKLDVAPDNYNQPDETTLTKNTTTGTIGITSAVMDKINAGDQAAERVGVLETKINNAYVPAPEYFTGTNANNQQLTLANNVTGNIVFDLYVSGVFQYPSTYTYNASTKKITLGFKVPAVSNNIAVIYRGIAWGTGTGVAASSTVGKFTNS